MKPEPTRIEPIFSPRIWGARSLAPLFREETNLAEPLGEAWLTGVDCKIATGPFAGKTLGEAWREMPPEWRGLNPKSVNDFPILLKFIFPKDKLSIQVHPDDAYAAVYEKAAGGRGKTEMWHIVSAEPGARLFAGFKPDVTRERFLESLAAHTLEDLFQAHPVHAGDTFFIPAGTPHTIGANVIVFEVQEYSDLTYRVYDYGRVDSHGKPRELHIEKALDVMNFKAHLDPRTRPLVVHREGVDLSLLSACKYFAAERWDLTSEISWRDDESFHMLTVLSGTGQFSWRQGSASYHPGECWFIPGNLGEWSVLPNGLNNILHAYVPCLESLKLRLKMQKFPETEISKAVFD